MSHSVTSFYALGKSLAQKWPFPGGLSHLRPTNGAINTPFLRQTLSQRIESCVTKCYIILCAGKEFGTKMAVSRGFKSPSAHKHSHKHSIYAPNLQPVHKIMYHMVTHYSVRCDIVWRKNGHFLGFKVLFGTQKQP